MQQCSLNVVCVSDKTPGTGYTVVRASGRFILEHDRPNKVHQNGDSPEKGDRS